MMNSFVTNAGVLKTLESYRVFASSLTQALQQKGLQDSFAEAFFDVLYVSKKPLDIKSPALSPLKDWLQNILIYKWLYRIQKIYGCCRLSMRFQ